MVCTSAATASLFPVSCPQPKSEGSYTSSNVRGMKTKTVNSSRGIQVKANNTHITPPAHLMNRGVKTTDYNFTYSHTSTKTFMNQLPDWSMLLAAMTTIFLAAEKQWMMLERMTKRPDMLSDYLHPFASGLIFRQNFSIRSYEIGADRTASIHTLMNHFQETALNHVKSAGLMGDGFGSTPEMSKKNLFWVVTKMQVVVDRYPTWGDVVQVDTWVAQSGKNGMRRDWLLRDYKTGEILTRASSNWVMMNKETRKLSKIPDEVRSEIEHYFVDAPPVVDDDGRKLPKLEETTADYVRNGLTPRWSDLDVNQHVNNVKYIGWLLESAPEQVVEKYELASMTLEYRRECRKDSVLKSLTSILGGGIPDSGQVNCQHVLQFESGSDGVVGGEIVKGRTKWRPKYENQIRSFDHSPDGTAY